MSDATEIAGPDAARPFPPGGADGGAGESPAPPATPADPPHLPGFDDYPIRLGDLMRGERATMGKSLLDVQRDIRIKAAYIAAIENCDPDAFESPGFIAGYVRSYARYLNLDPEAAYRQFCAESGFDGVHPDIRPARAQDGAGRPPVLKTGLETPLPPIGGRARRDPARPAAARKGAGARNAGFGGLGGLQPVGPVSDGPLVQVSASAVGSLLVLLLLIGALAYGAWAVLRDIQRVELEPVTAAPADLAAATPAPADPALRDPVATIAPRAAADATPLPAAEPELPPIIPRDGPIAALDPEEIGALVANNGARQAAATAARVNRPEPRARPPARSGPPTVAVVARRPAWIRVSLKDGSVLFEKILDSGESFRLPPGSAGTTVLRAGNAGAVYLTLDGTPYGPLGRDTQVVKDIPLDALAIAERFPKVADPKALSALENPRVITLNDR